MHRIMLATLVAFTPTLVLAAEVEETESTAYLNVNTVPDGIEIVVDNEIVGLTPISRMTFPAGKYSVGALFHGWERVEKDVTLEAGTTTDVRFYSVGEDEKGWFSERDALIGFAAVWGIAGISFLIWFTTALGDIE
ncbi:MAG: PEGA domain-containing protein [Candidatus Coatesbacteria bacterium]|nr:MAG: PEGA domain-containing protein [Candidatus Coatesbacteria bacterium]